MKTTKLVLRSTTQAQLAIELISNPEVILNRLDEPSAFGYLRSKLYELHYRDQASKDGFPGGDWEK